MLLFYNMAVNMNGEKPLQNMMMDYSIHKGASKCRGLKSKIAEDEHGRDADFFTTLQNQAKEVKSCGKRGASVKLKRALEEETREMAAKEGKKQKSAADKKTIKTKNDAEPAVKKSKSQSAKDLKLKEMIGFAGLTSSESDPSTDRNSLEEPQRRCSPRKKTSTDCDPSTDRNSLEEPQRRCSPRKKTSTDCDPSTDRNFLEEPQRRCSPRKKTSTDCDPSTDRNSLEEPQRRCSPRKKTSTDCDPSTDRNSLEEPQRRCSPRKKTSKDCDPSTDKNASNEYEGRRTENTQFKDATVTCISRKSTEKTTLETTSATSSLVSASLNLLNDNDVEPTDLAYNTGEFADFSHAYYVPEYGYNSNMVHSETCGQPSPVQNVIGYYQQLDSVQQGTILGFLNMLSSELHKITYGKPPSNSANQPCNSNMFGNNFSGQGCSALLVNAASADENERKVPLIMDKDGIFKDVLVNPSKLRNAESGALMARNPTAFLLNKVLDLVFHVDEMKHSKGVKGLNTHKMEAINGHLHMRLPVQKFCN